MSSQQATTLAIISVIDPREQAIGVVRGLDDGADFAEGHQVHPERAAKVPAKQVGRMLTPPQAKAASAAA